MLAALVMRTHGLCGSQGGLLGLPASVRSRTCLEALRSVHLISKQQTARHAVLDSSGNALGFAVHSSSTKQQTRAVAAKAHKQETAAAAAVAERIEEKELHVEASESYLAYAMSVIVGRALPDVRDGLKPVHRRILYAMHDMGISHSKPYKKCARVVGEVLGKYHPHGDTAVYDALVRLAQDFSMQLPLVAGQGNFGSLDDDPPAAMRYTECRLAAAAEDILLDDLEQGTVDFAATFDASQEEPLVLPAKVPHLLVNGAQGIAVGIATKIPPHNLHEVVAALRALVAEPGISNAQLAEHVPAPDFPTGGELVVGPETLAAYETGHGSVLLRATSHIEYTGSSSAKRRGASKSRKAAAELDDDAESAAAGGSGKALVVFTEMPYQVCKSDLCQRIAELVDAKVLDGIADVRDESDRTGVRLVVEVRRGFSPELVLNQLYKNTRLQLRFAANMVALVDGVPRTLTLKDCLQHFLDFRVEAIQRRARHKLAKAEARLHLVEGLLLALQHLDTVVQAIRSAADSAAAKAVLTSRFSLSDTQAEAVLAMTLRRLTGLEAGKLREEQQQLEATIADLRGLLASQQRLLEMVLQEAQAMADKHGRPRRSRILAELAASDAVKEEDIIPNTPSIITVSAKGFVKRMPSSTWEVQRRGGKGKSSGKLRDNDALDEVLSVMAHDTLLFLSTSGKAYSVKAHKVPEVSRTSSGSSVSQVLSLPAPERFPSLFPVHNFTEANTSLAMATTSGGIKRTALDAFSKVNKSGLIATKLFKGEQLAAGALAQEGSTVVLATSDGKLAHFPIDKVRLASRTAGCIKGMKLAGEEQVLAMVVLPPELATQVAAAQAAAKAADAAAEDSSSSSGTGANTPVDAAAGQSVTAAASSSSDSSSRSVRDESSGPWLLLVTRKGYGKRVPVTDVPLKVNRGSQGVIGVKLAAGDSLANARLVHSGDDDIVLASKQGLITRCRAADVNIMSRASRGVKVIALNDGDEVQTIAVVPAEHKTALA